MKCSEIQFDLAVYSDCLLETPADSDVRAHLSTCPVCRHAHAEHLEVQTGLRQLSRVEIPAKLRYSIRNAVARERQHEYFGWLPPTPGTREWLSRRLMPYAVGFFASIFIGIS